MRTSTNKMTMTTSIATSLLLVGALIASDHALAQRNEMPPGYPQSLERDLQALLARVDEGTPHRSCWFNWRKPISILPTTC